MIEPENSLSLRSNAPEPRATQGVVSLYWDQEANTLKAQTPTQSLSFPATDPATGDDVLKTSPQDLSPNQQEQVQENLGLNITDTFVSIGDSIMSDIGHGFWMDTVRRALGYRHAEVNELGLPGRTISDLAGNIVAELAGIQDGTPARPLCVFLGTALNDFVAGDTPAEVLANMQICIDAIHAKNGVVVVFNCPLYGPEETEIREYNESISDLYDSGGIDSLVDLFSLNFHTWDTTHPDEAGNVRIGRECLRALAGTPSSFPHNAILGVKTTLAITAISAAAAAQVTIAGHGLSTGDLVHITGSNSTPVIDGVHAVTVTGSGTFTVPVTTSVAGNTGAANTGVIRMFGGGGIHANLTVRIDSHNGSGGSVETFFGTQAYAYNNKHEFQLHSISYLPSDVAAVASPIFSGVAMVDSNNIVTCYLVNKSPDFLYTITWNKAKPFSQTDISAD